MLKETKEIDGEEHYQLNITGQWVKAHPVPELKEGLRFYTSFYPSPCFLLRHNQSPKPGIDPPIIPGRPPEDAGEYWLVFIPSSGSEPLMWFPRDYVEGQFQAGLYQQDPDRRPDYSKGMNYTTAWWWPILRDDLDYHEDDENSGLLDRLLDRLGW